MKFAFFLFTIAFSATVYAGIYEELWNLDQANNGLTPQELVTDEQRAYKNGGDDSADKPLFTSLHSEKTNRPTYTTIKALLDNYEFDGSKSEDALGANAQEDDERNAFLTEVLKTDVMKKTAEHLKLSEGSLRAELEREWFEPFTNFYGGKEDPNCTGFEHVFVGEESSSEGIGGYHFWYKFYLEELKGIVNYLGFNYSGVEGGEKEPYVATLGMSWDINGDEYVKPISGFLVGASPELMLAWGTLAYFDNVSFSETESVQIPVKIDKTNVKLVMYRETKSAAKKKKGKKAPKATMGDHIRSFYPKFVGLDKN